MNLKERKEKKGKGKEKIKEKKKGKERLIAWMKIQQEYDMVIHFSGSIS